MANAKKLASPNARDTNMLVFLALGDAKVLSFALGDAKVPDSRYFAFWWNIGFKFILSLMHELCMILISPSTWQMYFANINLESNILCILTYNNLNQS